MANCVGIVSGLLWVYAEDLGFGFVGEAFSVNIVWAYGLTGFCAVNGVGAANGIDLEHWGFQQLGILFWGLYHKDYCILVAILGPPAGSWHMGARDIQLDKGFGYRHN